MDAGIAAAARALEQGDVLGALKFVALRGDAHALAMRGVVMAQLGELDTARSLLRRARRSFDRQRDRLSVARCTVAHAEIEMIERRFGDDRALERAAKTLEKRGDVRNASWARIVAARRAIALGDLDRAEDALEKIEDSSPISSAVRALADHEIGLRRLDADRASAALAHDHGTIPISLAREIEEARAALSRPVARIGPNEATLEDVQRAHRRAFVIDACQRIVRRDGRTFDLRKRAIPFMLLEHLARAWPNDVSRDDLIAHVFDTKRPNESHRARLRVEIGRARTLAKVNIAATEHGFRLGEREVTLVLPLDDSPAHAVLALLARGDAWPVRSIAEALRISNRTAQRALADLEASGRVRSHGKGRSTRWSLASRIASTLLLPGLLTVR